MILISIPTFFSVLIYIESEGFKDKQRTAICLSHVIYPREKMTGEERLDFL